MTNDIEVDFNELDDAEFDLDTATILNGQFLLNGRLDWRQSVGLLVSGKSGASYSRASLRRELGRARKLIYTPLSLVIDEAVSYEVVDKAGTGALILESYSVGGGYVRLVGVIPCEVDVRTVGSCRPQFYRGDPVLP